jgi:hypothetical protein
VGHPLLIYSATDAYLLICDPQLEFLPCCPALPKPRFFLARAFSAAEGRSVAISGSASCSPVPAPPCVPSVVCAREIMGREIELVGEMYQGGRDKVESEIVVGPTSF